VTGAAELLQVLQPSMSDLSGLPLDFTKPFAQLLYFITCATSPTAAAECVEQKDLLSCRCNTIACADHGPMKDLTSLIAGYFPHHC
jgi:hypothetical protein